MHCFFPGFESHPWVLWIVSLASDYSLDECRFEAFLEQIDGPVIVKFDSSCCSKLFEFRYEDVKALFLSESGELVECFILYYSSFDLSSIYKVISDLNATLPLM